MGRPVGGLDSQRGDVGQTNGRLVDSATDFVHVFSDGEGNVHEQLLRFDVDGADASRVEIIGDGGESVVALRASMPGDGVPWPAVVIGVVIGAVIVAGLLRAVRGGHRGGKAPRAVTRHGTT